MPPLIIQRIDPGGNFKGIFPGHLRHGWHFCGIARPVLWLGIMDELHNLIVGILPLGYLYISWPYLLFGFVMAGSTGMLGQQGLYLFEIWHLWRCCFGALPCIGTFLCSTLR